jgi:cobalamin biosynthesis protein CobT
MKTKIILLSAIIFTFSLTSYAQTAGDFFNKAARSYVKTEKEQALQTVNDGLSKFPGDSKLQALKEKLEQEQEDEQNQNQEQQNQQNQEQQNQENQKSQGEQGEQQQNQDQGEKTEQDQAKESESGDPQEKSQDPASENANDQMDANLAERQKALEEFKEKLKAMNLTPEQAAQILESMNAAELRYIQQNRKKATQRPKRGIPDW